MANEIFVYDNDSPDPAPSSYPPHPSSVYRRSRLAIPLTLLINLDGPLSCALQGAR
jgi:hypothetical protein